MSPHVVMQPCTTEQAPKRRRLCGKSAFHGLVGTMSQEANLKTGALGAARLAHDEALPSYFEVHGSGPQHSDSVQIRASSPETPCRKRLHSRTAEAETPVKDTPQRDAPFETRAATPPRTCIVGREEERSRLRKFLECSLDSQQGKSLYISGGPGTGKTCCVRSVAAEWLEQRPGAKYIEVNCMSLQQRSIAGLLHRLMSISGSVRGLRRHASISGLSTAVTERLAEAFGSSPILLVVDEVDQLARRSASQCQFAEAYETLFSLPRLPQAPLISIIAIANSVDLLKRDSAPSEDIARCESLLFEAYTSVQLKAIMKENLNSTGRGDEVEGVMGRIAIERRVRQVANQSGDCRQILAFCEEGKFAASQSGNDEVECSPCKTSAASEDASVSSISNTHLAAVSAPSNQSAPWDSSAATPSRASASTAPMSLATAAQDAPCTLLKKPAAPPAHAAMQPPLPLRSEEVSVVKKPAAMPQTARRDPLADARLMPMEQQILLCVLARANSETMTFQEVRLRYKDFHLQLLKHKSQSDGCFIAQHVRDALAALEQRGLLSMVEKKGAGGRCRTARVQKNEEVVELAVGRQAVRAAISRANPLLERCMQ